MLIADDEPDMRALIAEVLRAQQIEVVAEASTAEETIALWRDFQPDVIVLDQRMPPMTGLAVAETILADEPGQVIFLFTALIDADLQDAADRVGIAAVVPKANVFDIPALVRAHLNPA